MPTDLLQHLLPQPLIDAFNHGTLELGGPFEHDPLVWFDSSSYGARTLDSMLRMVGVDRLVYGSDRPVIAAASPSPFGDAVEHALTTANPERALGLGVPA